MKKIGILAAVLLFMGVTTLAVAGYHGTGRCGEGSMGLGMLDALNLSPEQTEKVRALKESHFKEVLPIRSELFNKKAELRLLWLQTAPDVEKIKATQAEIWALMKQMGEKRTDFRLALRNLLTPEQVTRLLSTGAGKGHGKGLGPRDGRNRGGGFGPGSGKCFR
ncbi:MAG: Spy/CpxP family protein refolding chaperone [Deltaproteobacteria bacterium]|nr:Spy/CpxP family protein refolding chaperone [Deltaproteobacteria bacterium]